MTVLAASLIDLSAVWKITVVALGGSIGVALTFGLAVVSGTRSQERRGAGQPWRLNGLIASAALLICLAAAAFGIAAMTHK